MTLPPYEKLNNSVLIAASLETNILMQCGSKEDYVVNMYGMPIELTISNQACISQYSLKSDPDPDPYFELSVFPEDYLQTMKDAEDRIKIKHGDDLILPIRHRKMGTTFSFFMPLEEKRWEYLFQAEKFNELDEIITSMTESLIQTANRFINNYRLVTGDNYIKNIAQDNTSAFFNVFNSQGQIHSIAKNPYIGQKIKWNDENQKKLDLLLSEKKEPDYPLDRMLIGAFSLKNEGNLSVSFVVLITGLEIMVSKLYRRRMVNMGVAENVIKQQVKRSLKELLKKDEIHLILDLPEKIFINEKFLDQLVNAYDKRNKIVHGGLKIPDDQLMNYWKDVLRFFEYFATKEKDFFFTSRFEILNILNKRKMGQATLKLSSGINK